MAKINFTKDHFMKMANLATQMLFANTCVNNKLGQPLNVVELIHTTTIGTLNDIRVSLDKAIEKLSNQDEWASPDNITDKLELLRSKREFVNYVIGYKRYMLEQEENARTKKELQDKLIELKESQKTPEDKIKELEAQIAAIDSDNF